MDFQSWFVANQPKLIARAYCLLSDWTAADSVVDQVYDELQKKKPWQKKHPWPPGQKHPPVAWERSYAICFYQGINWRSVDWRRAHPAGQTVPLDFEPAFDSDEEWDEKNQVLLKKLQQCLEAIAQPNQKSEQRVKAFLLHAVEEKSSREIAAILSEDKTSVARWIKEVHAQMQQRLGINRPEDVKKIKENDDG